VLLKLVETLFNFKIFSPFKISSAGFMYLYQLLNIQKFTSNLTTFIKVYYD